MSTRPFVLIASVALLVACGDTVAPVTESVSVRVDVAPSNVAIGDTSRISITVTNTSLSSFKLADGACNQEFVIETTGGAVMLPAEQVYCTLELRVPINLAPSESYHMSRFTTGRVIPEGSQAAPVTLAPGTYVVRASIAVWRGNNEGVVLRGDPVPITFRARN